jgi:catechol 2,3-dioxygenase-like lactoylglutathione lyase family enzyme
MKAFYTRVLGLQRLAEEPTRHVFFHVGPAQVLLIFNPAATQQGEALPPHGALGPGHVALGIPADELDAWRTHLRAEGVDIEAEITWPRGGQSLYFRDPGGNSVELVTPGIWGTPAGW